MSGTRSYEHKRFPSGTTVYITPDINRYRSVPIAGKTLQTCVGTVHENLEPFGENQEAKVPVEWKGQVFYVEEEYVFLVGGQG